MSHFEKLHPAVQHHIVNSLGWRSLRPFQDAVIPPVLAGTHLIILAPTAGGKTEAAFLPVLSRMLTEGWSGLSVLYICPIKALLNNLDTRLERYCTPGRASGRLSGMATSSRRQGGAFREPPDCLLTTPESLEVMLVSPQRRLANAVCRAARRDRRRGPRVRRRRPGLASLERDRTDLPSRRARTAADRAVGNRGQSQRPVGMAERLERPIRAIVLPDEANVGRRGRDDRLCRVALERSGRHLSLAPR